MPAYRSWCCEVSVCVWQVCAQISGRNQAYLLVRLCIQHSAQYGGRMALLLDQPGLQLVSISQSHCNQMGWAVLCVSAVQAAENSSASMPLLFRRGIETQAFRVGTPFFCASP